MTNDAFKLEFCVTLNGKEVMRPTSSLAEARAELVSQPDNALLVSHTVSHWTVVPVRRCDVCSRYLVEYRVVTADKQHARSMRGHCMCDTVSTSVDTVLVTKFKESNDG